MVKKQSDIVKAFRDSITEFTREIPETRVLHFTFYDAIADFHNIDYRRLSKKLRSLSSVRRVYYSREVDKKSFEGVYHRFKIILKRNNKY